MCDPSSRLGRKPRRGGGEKKYIHVLCKHQCKNESSQKESKRKKHKQTNKTRLTKQKGSKQGTTRRLKRTHTHTHTHPKKNIQTKCQMVFYLISPLSLFPEHSKLLSSTPHPTTASHQPTKSHPPLSVLTLSRSLTCHHFFSSFVFDFCFPFLPFFFIPSCFFFFPFGVYFCRSPPPPLIRDVGYHIHIHRRLSPRTRGAPCHLHALPLPCPLSPLTRTYTRTFLLHPPPQRRK